MIFIYRTLACILQLVITLDEILQVLVRSPIYIVTGINAPTAHETVSEWVGKSAASGQEWAIEAAKLLDSIFGKNHCANQAAFESSVDTPV